ncbi:MAG TPA: ThuA domain-containing protein, partial [Isosphaeraceae bacterium]|nr:ThuA domain-containing protein [Isosphaeraceae bacterium]
MSTERALIGAISTMSNPLLRLTLLLFLALPAARAEEPLKICLLSGSEEYESDRTLSDYQKHLEAHYPVRCTLLKAEGTDHLPGLKALDDCDVALFFTRRLTISGDELEAVKRYVLAGKPIVGVRTASHGFQNWLEFDKLVLGDNYQGHYSNKMTMRATVVPEAKDHPVVQGVGMIASQGSLYKTEPLADDCHLLMMGKSPEGTQPVAWTREFRGGRVFYTSLGAQGDFQNASFLRLLTNGLFWAAGREIPREAKADQPALRPRPEGTLHLSLRTRVETFRGSGHFDEVTVSRDVPIAETAVVICDMWDKHWCTGANERCGAIAQKMNPVLTALREKGVQIVHAPSECM